MKIKAILNEARHHRDVAKFYPHDIASARKQSKEWRKLPLGEKQIAQLINTLENGLPDCYDNYTDFMADFHGDFSHSIEESVRIFQYILAHPQFPAIAAAVARRWDYDLEDDFTQAIKELTELNQAN